jgi:hypothetical protein
MHLLTLPRWKWDCLMAGVGVFVSVLAKQTQTSTMSQRTLILVPLGGLGNRLRALASGVLLAASSDRAASYIHVPPLIDTRHQRPCEPPEGGWPWDLHSPSIGDLFDNLHPLTEWTTRAKVTADLVLESEAWTTDPALSTTYQPLFAFLHARFEIQNTSHGSFTHTPSHLSAPDSCTVDHGGYGCSLHDLVHRSKAPVVICICTCYQTPFEGSTLDVVSFENHVRHVYRRWTPKPMFVDAVRRVRDEARSAGSVMVGVHFRGTDRKGGGSIISSMLPAEFHATQYVDEVNRVLGTSPHVVVVCSDDVSFKRDLIARLTGTARRCIDGEQYCPVPDPFALAYTDFLFLAHCDVLIGSFRSSFLKEASLFSSTVTTQRTLEVTRIGGVLEGSLVRLRNLGYMVRGRTPWARLFARLFTMCGIIVRGVARFATLLTFRDEFRHSALDKELQ